MENKSDKNDTGQHTIGQEPDWPAGLNSEGLPLPDPRLVEKLVEELKSQGKFDQIRNDCFAEVDTQVGVVFYDNSLTSSHQNIIKQI